MFYLEFDVFEETCYNALYGVIIATMCLAPKSVTRQATLVKMTLAYFICWLPLYFMNYTDKHYAEDHPPIAAVVDVVAGFYYWIPFTYFAVTSDDFWLRVLCFLISFIFCVYHFRYIPETDPQF